MVKIMFELPMISVIIPVYNSERYLERCVKSIREQTYRNLEIILIDDGSTDKSGEICDRLADIDRRIKSFHKSNGGQASARNYGLEIARGDYIGFVDNDDIIDNRMYEVLMNNLQKYKVLVSAVIPDWIYENKTVVPSEGFPSRIYSGKELLKNMLRKENIISSSVWDKIFDKSLFETVRFPVGCEFEDYWVLSQILPNVDNVYIDTIPMYHWYQYNTSRSKSGFHDKSRTYISIPQKIVQSYIEKALDSDIIDAARYFLFLGYIRYFGKVFKSHKKIDCEDKNYQRELKNLLCNYKEIIKSKQVYFKCKVLSSIMIYPYAFLWRIKNR